MKKLPIAMTFCYDFEEDFPEVWKEVSTKLNQDRYLRWFELIEEFLDSEHLPSCFTTQEIWSGGAQLAFYHTVYIDNKSLLSFDTWCMSYYQFLDKITHLALEQSKAWHPSYLNDDEIADWEEQMKVRGE
jgi:hypothetical protein